MTETVGLAELRRYLVAHQHYARRPRNARADDLAAEVRRLGCVQLDSISTVDRAHRLTLSSRIGRFRPAVVSDLLRAGRLFEYWAHEACLLPIEDFPLFKRRMEHLRERHWWGREHAHDPELRERVLAALREHGALPTRFFEGRGGGGMWNWKPEKRILEDLLAAGEVVVAGRHGFQRLYALPEQVIRREYLEAPVPSEAEFLRGYARVAVEDGGAPVVLPAEAVIDGPQPAGGVLVSPFDNLLWDKAFVERVFGFEPLIEVYKREHERVYGYYVLPFLYGDRLVGRADLKADRAQGVLHVKAFHLEPRVRHSRALDDAFERAAARLARSIDLERVSR